jgi:competence ComEA-like helix-hairpin-helix protein
LVVALLAFAVTCAPAQKKPPAKPLDLNTATVEQLTQLPGVGPVTAQAIVDFRKKSGPFRRVEDLLAIRGITDRRLKQLRPYVTVQPAKKAGWYAPHGAILRALLTGGNRWPSLPALA